MLAWQSWCTWTFLVLFVTSLERTQDHCNKTKPVLASCDICLYVVNSQRDVEQTFVIFHSRCFANYTSWNILALTVGRNQKTKSCWFDICHWSIDHRPRLSWCNVYSYSMLFEEFHTLHCYLWGQLAPMNWCLHWYVICDFTKILFVDIVTKLFSWIYLDQWFSTFHGLWPPFKDSQRFLWSPDHQ